MTNLDMTSPTVVTLTFALLLPLTTHTVHGQESPAADTVVVPLAETSKIIFTIQDHHDLEVLKHYNFQELFQDIFRKLGDSTAITSAEENVQEPDTTASPDDRYADDAHYIGGCVVQDMFGWGGLFFGVQAGPPDPEIVGADRWRPMWMERLEKLQCWVADWMTHQHRDDF